MKQTNLEMIKEVSKMLFTAVPIKSVKGLEFLVQHPFASNSIISVPKDTDLKAYREAINKELCKGKTKAEHLEDLNNMAKCNLIDITIPEGAEVYKQFIFNLIDESKTLGEIIMLLNKPWYMTFIKFTEAYISPSDLGRILADCWIMQEFPSRDSNVGLKEIINWFRKADKEILMDSIEYSIYERKIKEPSVTVYRGVSHDGKPEGLSWTTDYEKALWFASRFKSENTKVYKMNITNPDAILAYFSGRNEQEVVVDTTICNNWEVVVE